MTLTARDHARTHWTANPCGTGDYLSGVQPDTLDWFEAIRRSRYEVTDRWMTRFIPFEEGAGRRLLKGEARQLKLLEIGHGIGSDLVTWAEHGAEVHGVDITEEHHRLCRRNFQLRGMTAELTLADAAALPYPDETFDLVYSNGVLHHVPDIARCLAEARRVLKPDGRLIFTVYARYSAFHLVYKCLYHGLRCGMWPRLGYRGLMATLEHGADGVNVKPLVNTYSVIGLEMLLSQFWTVRIRKAHLEPHHFATLGKLVSPKAARVLEPLLGWYLVAEARK